MRFTVFMRSIGGFVYGAVYWGKCFIKGITGFIIGRLQVRYFNENLLVGLLVVLIGTVLNSLFMLALGLSTFKIFNLDTLHHKRLHIPKFI